MRSRWSDDEARAFIDRYHAQGVGEDVALRVYTSRLLGVEPRLVQHGGGNTSVKTAMRDVLGDPIAAICVKGSGWDLSDIEPPGLPAMKLEPLLRLRRLKALSDEAMVDAQRSALLDSKSPNPSVEALLHAWIPHRFVDHTHANAVLALTDQPDGEGICNDLYGGRIAVAPYRMPGFGLAHLAAEVFEANPRSEGMVLLKHGIFTWGDTAQEAYERMIAYVSMAEDRIADAPARGLVQVALPDTLAEAADVAPIIRGLLAEAQGEGRWRRVVLDHRDREAARAFAAGEDAARYANAGVVTPDHVIRIKPRPLLLTAPRAGALDAFRAEAKAALADYLDAYRGYFDRNNAAAEPKKTALDPYPRVVLVPGLGLFAAGASAKEAAVAGDIAETTATVIADAERVGRFESISEADIFDVEYWSLEQAKLGKAKPKALQGQVVAITGGAGTLGQAIGRAFAAEGADVVLLDLDEAATEAAAKGLKGRGLACDVTDDTAVEAAFRRIAATRGGLDILVSNAGAAWTGRIGEVADATLRASFELNFFAHQRAAQAAVRIMRAQGTGGTLLFNISKQALNPGPDFGPYGIPKAAALALMRQYAVDHGADGIRANAVNADRIRSGLLTGAMIAERAAARGTSEAGYMSGNLLGAEVTADDVARAFVSLALAERTTGAVLTVDGGNIAAAVR
jgi:rhamnose utilization protein RhaD (predicted bifunctional aldolase and dehydrogenase)/NAD(P)-dependent dehydrogenase (short-subunit alcohol dehydrogenase family)